jgi:hypothetical protein
MAEAFKPGGQKGKLHRALGIWPEFERRDHSLVKRRVAAHVNYRTPHRAARRRGNVAARGEV